MQRLSNTILVVFLVLTSPANSESGEAAIEIHGTTYSVSNKFVISQKRSWTSASPPFLWIAFSSVSHEPLGLVNGPDGKPALDMKRRSDLRARGEDIIELRLEPDQGRLYGYEKSRSEKMCQLLGKFDTISEQGVAGYSCSALGKAMRRYFPIPISVGQAMLICRHQPDIYAAKSREFCDVFVEGRPDKVSLVLQFVDISSIGKIPELVNATERFISQRMKQTR